MDPDDDRGFDPAPLCRFADRLANVHLLAPAQVYARFVEHQIAVVAWACDTLGDEYASHAGFARLQLKYLASLSDGAAL